MLRAYLIRTLTVLHVLPNATAECAATMVAVGAAVHVRGVAVVSIRGNVSVFRIVMGKVAAMMGVVILAPLAMQA